MRIEKQEYKPLTSRTEIEAKVEAKITPSNLQIQEELSKKLEKDKELIVVKHIYQSFGKHEAKIIAYVYDSKEALKKFEPKKKERKQVVKEVTGETKEKEKIEEKK
ncbi:MAG: hypothetical protein QXP53_00140 [Candidatus Pacearchaeota archaeon]